MPNHVTHKIIFSAEHTEKIFQATCPDGKFNFNTLIPTPIYVYQGHLSSEDEQDFVNWYDWNRTHWGTKWNCYEQSCGIDDEKGFIKFDTAWNVPYQVIVAFANTFKIDFEHRYFDEGHNFWGIENWTTKEQTPSRISKKRDDLEIKRLLCMELKGYDPDAEE